jgi:hypothetical protein
VLRGKGTGGALVALVTGLERLPSAGREPGTASPVTRRELLDREAKTA